MDQSETALKNYSDSGKFLESFSDNEHRELRYRNHYNSGIIYFEKEDYNSAAQAFKEALKADPEKTDAKRNLELSLLSITLQQTTRNPSESRQQQKEILFDYLREEEEQRWKSREWAPEENFTGPDY
jgi:Ca-activated chloride channel family protein